MKKFGLILTLLMLSGLFCSAQTMTVTATGITDSDSTLWSNGTVAVSFVPNPSYPNPSIYTVCSTGAALNPAILNQAPVSIGSGASFSVTTYDNSLVCPAGSQWKFTVCPNASAACGAATTATTGSSQDVTSLVEANIVAPRFNAIAGTYGYADVEAQLQLKTGSNYWNVTDQCQKYYSSGWQCGNLPAGVVCTGTGSAQVCTFPGTVQGATLTATTSVTAGSNPGIDTPAWGETVDQFGGTDATYNSNRFLSTFQLKLNPSASTTYVEKDAIYAKCYNADTSYNVYCGGIDSLSEIPAGFVNTKTAESYAWGGIFRTQFDSSSAAGGNGIEIDMTNNTGQSVPGHEDQVVNGKAGIWMTCYGTTSCGWMFDGLGNQTYDNGIAIRSLVPGGIAFQMENANSIDSTDASGNPLNMLQSDASDDIVIGSTTNVGSILLNPGGTNQVTVAPTLTTVKTSIKEVVAAGIAEFTLDDHAGTNQTTLDFQEADVDKFQTGVDSGGNFSIFDVVNLLDPLQVSALGNTTLGETGKEVTLLGLVNATTSVTTPYVKTNVYTVATLPAGLAAGSQVTVSDATTFTPGACVGGGSDTVLAVYSGAAWNCM